jgi:lipoprotein signal peptidase
MATYDASRALRSRFLSIMIPVLLMGILTDQASKSWASLRAAEPCILVPGYLAAYSVPNAGSILGLGRDQAWTSTIFALLGIACAILVVLIAYSDPARWRVADCLAGAVLLAGIFGNTLDRLALGHVRDFLVTWAIPDLFFNVADLLLIVGGASLLMARAWGSRGARSDFGQAGSGLMTSQAA